MQLWTESQKDANVARYSGIDFLLTGRQLSTLWRLSTASRPSHGAPGRACPAPGSYRSSRGSYPASWAGTGSLLGPTQTNKHSKIKQTNKQSVPTSVRLLSARLCSSDKARLLVRARKDQNLRDALFLLAPQFPLKCQLSHQVGSLADKSNKAGSQDGEIPSPCQPARRPPLFATI